MKIKKKNLFIIFGTTQGVGNALYQYIAQFKENKFIIANRRTAKLINSDDIAIKIDLSKIITPAKLSLLFSPLRRQQYKNIYLINNASIVQPIKTVGNISSGEVIDNIYVNFLNYAIIINEFIKITKNFKKTKVKILNISSGAAISPTHGFSIYCSSKAALEMLTQTIFLEQLILKQVDILAVRPGIINTNMQKTMRSSKKENFTKIDLYKKLYKENKLSSREFVAEKIYKILINKKYWEKPIVDINEVK